MIKINRKTIWLTGLALIALVAVWLIFLKDAALAPTVDKSNSPEKSKKAEQTTLPQFDKKQHSINDPASLWVIVNKGRALPSDYVPSGLRQASGGDSSEKLRDDAAGALEKMFADALVAGHDLVLFSGYRSYASQAAIHANFVKSQGQQYAEQTSARAGHSEHQTGLAVDISSTSGKCTLEECFGDTDEGKWLAANAYKFGFVIRYPKDQQNLTGYAYEPWHFRFVGVELAAEINKTNQTLEQFFELPTFSSYPADIYQLKTGA